jgi:hypothetical protein
MLELMDEQIKRSMLVNGEYYVSTTYELLLESGDQVVVPIIPYFFQWGTPQDFEESNYWFEALAQTNIQTALEQIPTHLLPPSVTKGSPTHVRIGKYHHDAFSAYSLHTLNNP